MKYLIVLFVCLMLCGCKPTKQELLNDYGWGVREAMGRTISFMEDWKRPPNQKEQEEIHYNCILEWNLQNETLSFK